MKRNDADQKYKWNLNDIYKSKEEFLKDLDLHIENIRGLKKYKGKLNLLSEFKKFRNESFTKEKVSSKLNHFLKIILVEQNNEMANELEQIYISKMQEFDGEFTWIQEEIKQVGKKKVLEWLDTDEDLKPYKKSYKEFFKNIKYMLPEQDRKLLSKVSNSSSLIDDMYDTLKYKDNIENELIFQGKTYIADQKTITDILNYSDPIKDQKLRRLLYLKYKENIKNNKFTFAKLYESLVKEEIESTKLVGMKSFTENFFDEDDFDLKSFLNLISFGSKYSSIYYEYYGILKKHFGFNKKFYSTDSSLILAKDEKKVIEVEEAKQIIFDALKPLSDEYKNELENAFGENKIDYFEDKNKSTGAFTISDYYFDSLVSMNYTHDIESVSTLAHEIGHAVHNNFSKNNQKIPLNSFGNIIAEVSSTLNEHLLFDYLISHSKNDQEKLNLLQHRIEFIFGNFFGAISEAKFEYDIFKHVEKNDPLSVDTISNIMKKASKKIFGKSIFSKIDKNIGQYGWISVSHFFEQPFYIYKYAVSIAVSFKLFEHVKNGKPNLAVEFLKEGGNLNPVPLFKKYGFDPTNIESFMPIVNECKNMIEQIKNILKID